MRRMLLGTIALAFFLTLPLAADVPAQQLDPLKRVREKMEQLQKKIDCAVNDKTCTEKPKQDGAEVKTPEPAPTPGAPPQTPGATAQTPGASAGNASPLNAEFTSTYSRQCRWGRRRFSRPWSATTGARCRCRDEG